MSSATSSTSPKDHATPDCKRGTPRVSSSSSRGPSTTSDERTPIRRNTSRTQSPLREPWESPLKEAEETASEEGCTAHETPKSVPQPRSPPHLPQTSRSPYPTVPSTTSAACPPTQTHASRPTDTPKRKQSRHHHHRHHHPQPTDSPYHSQSLPDRIGAAALGGTMDLLRFTTGVALQTTGALVAPPLHVTKTLLLPQLMAVIRAHWQETAPLRLQDWLRIVVASVSHVVTILRSTAQGVAMRKALVRLLVDLGDVLTSPLLRQVAVDGMAAVVKLAEAMSTPQAHDSMTHMALGLTRVLQLLAARPVRQCLQDVVSVVQTLAALLADPTTVVALAQVTADLCYALEAEEADLYKSVKRKEKNEQKSDGKESGPGDTEEEGVEDKERSVQQERRKDRNRTEALTSTDKLLASDPNASMEQVILSSLGEPVDSLCQQLEKQVIERQNDGSMHSDIIKGAANQVDEMEQRVESLALNDSWHAMPTDETMDNLPPPPNRDGSRVDAIYLHQTIHQRSRRMQLHMTAQNAGSAQGVNSHYTQRSRLLEVVTSDDDNDLQDESGAECGIAVDIEELGRSRSTEPTNIRLSYETDTIRNDVSEEDKIAAGSSYDRAPQVVNTERLKDESPLDHFYRVLDETITSMRKEALKSVVLSGDTNDSGSNRPSQGRVFRKMDGLEPQDLTKASLREFINNVRDEISEEQRKRKTAKPTKYLNYTLVAILLGLIICWALLGCYGLFVLLNPNPVRQSSISSALLNDKTMSPHDTTNTQEIVIRVVREVVHVDKEGRVMGNVAERKFLPEADVDKLTQCIMNSNS